MGGLTYSFLSKSLTRLKMSTARGQCALSSPALLYADFVQNTYYTRTAGQTGVTDHARSDLLEFTGPAGREYTGSDGTTLTTGLNQPRVGNYIDTGSGLFNGGILIDDAAGENLSFRQSMISTVFGAAMPAAVSILIDGHMTYTDDDVNPESIFFNWRVDGNNRLQAKLLTDSGTGAAQTFQVDAGDFTAVNSAVDIYAPGNNVPFAWGSRHGASFINGAHDGTLLTAGTPSGLPDLISATFEIAPLGSFVIRRVALIGDDITDAGIQSGSAPAGNFNPLCPFDGLAGGDAFGGGFGGGFD